jgi:hypothetical protein
MMTTVLSPEITTVDWLAERCDRCGFAAKLAAVLTAGGELTFCGHHANRYAEEIARIAAKITVEDGFDWAAPAPAA